MARIEIYPLVINEKVATDKATNDAAAQVVKRLIDLGNDLKPILDMATSDDPLGGFKASGAWTNEHTEALIGAVIPFMRKPEAEARAELMAATFSERADALKRSLEMVVKAKDDAEAMLKKRDASANN